MAPVQPILIGCISAWLLDTLLKNEFKTVWKGSNANICLRFFKNLVNFEEVEV